MSLLAQHLVHVHERIAAAARRSGRAASDVTLVAVTKYVPVGQDGLIRDAMEAGIRHFGENRVQDAVEKISQWAAPADHAPLCWHMIGHIQSNKVSKAAELFDRVDSLDRWEIAEMLDRRCKALGKKMEVLLEIKLSQETAKTGLPEKELPVLLEKWKDIKNLNLRGLMTMAPLHSNADASRGIFRRLRELRDALNAKHFLSRPLDVLSMGMSGDFEIAIEEGATEVRIGQILFGERRVA